MSIKDEPFSPTDDINVVDDDDVTDDKFKVRRTTTTSATTTCLLKKQQQQSSNINKAAESKLPQLRQTVRLTRVRIFIISMHDVIYRQSPVKNQPVKPQSR